MSLSRQNCSIRDKREEGTAAIHQLSTDNMAADIFTNSLLVWMVETFAIFLIGTDTAHSAQFLAGVLDF